ncbi:OmpH family outer membrane protein [Alteriqipengyuania sp. 357]
MNYRNLAAAGAVAFASLALSAPVSAQVNGIATADRALAVARAQALQTGYEQIRTQYQAQITQATQLQQQRDVVVRGLDTDGDGQLSDAEVATAPEATKQQVGSLDQQIDAIQAPIQRARIWVVSQIGQQYAQAVQQVIQERSIQIMLAPNALIYAPENADVTASVTAAINTLAPTVQVTPPADWQPSQAGAQLYQEIQQLIMLSAMQQRQAAAAQQGQQPAAQQPAAQPTGR